VMKTPKECRPFYISRIDDKGHWEEIKGKLFEHSKQPPIEIDRWERRRKFLKHVKGRCLNCLATDHRVLDCRRSTRCWRCLEPGHESRQCPSLRSCSALPVASTKAPRGSPSLDCACKSLPLSLQTISTEDLSSGSDGRGGSHCCFCSGRV
jgi:hypothetical protein